MKKKVLPVLLVAISIIAFFYWNYRYVQFYPVEFNNEEYVVDEKSTSTEFYNNLKKVLNYYGEDFKEDGGIIYVKNKMFRNRELSSNYTKKAKDTTWLLEKK
jgi:hypothetical protein